MNIKQLIEQDFNKINGTIIKTTPEVLLEVLENFYSIQLEEISSGMRVKQKRLELSQNEFVTSYIESFDEKLERFVKCDLQKFLHKALRKDGTLFSYREDISTNLIYTQYTQGIDIPVVLNKDFLDHTYTKWGDMEYFIDGEAYHYASLLDFAGEMDYKRVNKQALVEVGKPYKPDIDYTLHVLTNYESDNADMLFMIDRSIKEHLIDSLAAEALEKECEDLDAKTIFVNSLQKEGIAFYEVYPNVINFSPVNVESVESDVMEVE